MVIIKILVITIMFLRGVILEITTILELQDSKTDRILLLIWNDKIRISKIISMLRMMKWLIEYQILMIAVLLAETLSIQPKLPALVVLLCNDLLKVLFSPITIPTKFYSIKIVCPTHNQTSVMLKPRLIEMRAPKLTWWNSKVKQVTRSKPKVWRHRPKKLGLPILNQ